MASPRDLMRPSKQVLMDAHDCGANAFYDGESFSDNPWGCFSHAAEHHAWNAGYRQAVREEPKYQAVREAVYAQNNGKTLAQILWSAATA